MAIEMKNDVMENIQVRQSALDLKKPDLSPGRASGVFYSGLV